MTSRMIAVMPISWPAWLCEICLQFEPARSLQDRAEPYLRHRQVSVLRRNSGICGLALQVGKVNDCAAGTSASSSADVYPPQSPASKNLHMRRSSFVIGVG
jgi:hypothetical protein